MGDHEVRAAEARVDQVIGTMPLEARDLDTAIWTLLSATEDSLRLPLLNTKEPLVVSDYISSSDLTKYGLKHAMAELRRRSYPLAFRKIPKAVDAGSYKQAVRLLRSGRNYQAAVAGFSAYHAGMNDCDIVGGTIHFRPAKNRDVRYRVRDVLESMCGSDNPTSLLKLLDWTTGELPEVLEAEAAATAVLAPRRIVYKQTGIGERSLFEDFSSARSLLPDDWATPHGDKRTVERVLRALLAICAHHYLMITRGAAIHHVHGIGLASLVLQSGLEELVSRVARLADVSTAAVTGIFDLLTYGAGTDSPDPALQPLYIIGDRYVLCPAMMVCQSDLERNYLSLLARVDPHAFNAASSAFERQMTNRLRQAISHTRWSCSYNRTYRSIRSAGEIDVLAVDTDSKEILVLELWWTIPPGETREVLQRERTSLDKTAQAARKVEAVRANVAGVVGELCAGAFADGWTVSGAVVSESFLPTLRRTSEIAVISRRTIQRLLGVSSTLADVRTSLSKEEWLPVPGRHFNPRIVECELGGVKFTLQTMDPTMRGLRSTRDSLDPE